MPCRRFAMACRAEPSLPSWSGPRGGAASPGRGGRRRRGRGAARHRSDRGARRDAGRTDRRSSKRTGCQSRPGQPKRISARSASGSEKFWRWWPRGGPTRRSRKPCSCRRTRSRRTSPRCSASCVRSRGRTWRQWRREAECWRRSHRGSIGIPFASTSRVVPEIKSSPPRGRGLHRLRVARRPTWRSRVPSPSNRRESRQGEAMPRAVNPLPPTSSRPH